MRVSSEAFRLMRCRKPPPSRLPGLAAVLGLRPAVLASSGFVETAAPFSPTRRGCAVERRPAYLNTASHTAGAPRRPNTEATLPLQPEPVEDERRVQRREERSESRPLRLVEEEPVAGGKEVADVDLVFAGDFVYFAL